ncbi:hypothetical protein NS274_01240 [Pseudomonas oryzihabitans]|uniref:hypothetical protein n=1 Tax=Pseudomonas rhizoryzae TaxID=2571129 RepID=UPI000736BC10|nr:hypothetical protein [Pseudomonas rhizoryzae]APQ13622.1 hypothetical protein BJP27_19770 [Pseudomonas psychrotolerans]KTS79593.1 hypothetical protein NS274_01240 [Pseudomonas psychrotolerans]KTT29368.1 hypothetical protein SB9_21630 [Pseudomonas psychrotolerans]KTT34817.1 hypothetical protein NS201_01290 [Pseudomonas psychrotolerans]KTT78113.1 hypothetical protein SB18R_03755 [Pseudomonas psychrotolerans]
METLAPCSQVAVNDLETAQSPARFSSDFIDRLLSRCETRIGEMEDFPDMSPDLRLIHMQNVDLLVRTVVGECRHRDQIRRVQRILRFCEEHASWLQLQPVSQGAA